MLIEKQNEPSSKIALKKIMYGTIVLYQNHKYIKVNKNPGSGITLKCNSGFSVLLNLRHGTLREVHGDICVDILHIKNSIKAIILTNEFDILEYVRY